MLFALKGSSKAPLACQATHLGANYTAHVHYTITLDLQ
jgi:hypothetical protein